MRAWVFSSHCRSAVSNGAPRMLRAARRASGGWPRIVASISYNAAMRCNASNASGDCVAARTSKNFRRACAQQAASVTPWSYRPAYPVYPSACLQDATELGQVLSRMLAFPVGAVAIQHRRRCRAAPRIKSGGRLPAGHRARSTTAARSWCGRGPGPAPAPWCPSGQARGQALACTRSADMTCVPTASTSGRISRVVWPTQSAKVERSRPIPARA